MEVASVLRRIAIISGLLFAGACSAGGNASFSGGLGNGANNGAGANGAGANGAGGDGLLFGGGAAAGTNGFPMNINGDCVANVHQGEKVPLDLYIMFDQSLSMTCKTANGTSRWDAVKSALLKFVQDPAANGINVGIQYFGLGSIPIFSSCNVSDYVNADVEIGPLPQNATPLVNSLNGHGPATNTPTAVALQGAIQHATSWKGQHPGDTVVVVLVTDGEPNACGALADVENAAKAGVASNILTYVIGVVAGGTSCGLDPNPPNQADLDAVAAAGGTQHALIVDASQDAEQQFLTQMNQIRGQAQIPCQFQIPPPPAGETFDPSLVNIEFTDSTGAPTIVYAVPDANHCDPSHGGGWYFDNPTAPTSLLLCPTTCSTVTTTVGLSVKVALGCQSIQVPK